ncbi:MAG TPA: hypothetical protein VLS90_09010 [Thermodesulfobacteriota bacterium]|nr:hypothetical protein [Thermodesulfobacteriota bacterium]
MESLTGLPQITRDSACALLNNPQVVSEYFIAQVLKRRQKGSINLHDARELIEDYLTALCGGNSHKRETAPGALAGRTKE